MKAIKSKIIKLSEAILEFFICWRRALFIPFFFILVLMEASEMKDGQTIHYVELLIYFVLLIFIALLIEMLLRAYRLQNRAVKILDYKHQINRVLITPENWDDLADSLVKQLAQMADVKGAQMFLWEAATQEFSLLAQWSESNGNDQSTYSPCQTCAAEWLAQAKAVFGPCRHTDASDGSGLKAHCLPIYFKGGLFALVRFMPRHNQIFNNDQIQILGNLGDEIAIALAAGQDRKRLVELQAIQVALAERHKVSQYLHDNLGQNISYLKMKLEQINLDPSLLQRSNASAEIQRMKETADAAYVIVRSKLENIHLSTMPTLASYLREHAHRITERAGFEFTFAIKGTPKPISTDVQRAVIYVFQEALSNVEKHARATKVDVVLAWGRDNLVLIVTDNGIGFNPHSIDQDRHFGLGIVRERLTDVGGGVEINSTKNSGTVVAINAPFTSTRKRT